MKDTRYAIGVDIGGTKINIGLIDHSGRVVRELTLPSMSLQRRVMEQVASGIAQLLAACGESAEPIRPCGIGVGSAGQIDFTTGSVLAATDILPGYAGTPIRAMLEAAFRLPVYVDNDVNVLALSELYFGGGENRDFICLALGTGVGGGIVSDGKLVRGKQGIGGEIGHIPVDFRGPACMCGGRGCLELYASGSGIANRVKEKRAAAGDGGEDWSARETAERWLAGDPIASAVMEEAIDALAAALAGLIHTFNPGRIVIGGGVADIGEPLLARLRSETDARTMPAFLEAVRISPASFGGRSGMIGAAVQVFHYGDRGREFGQPA